MPNSTTYDIIRGISQAASMCYDGAVDKEGEPIKVGLRREEGNPLIDKRVMDGFSVSFHGDSICVHYHSEMTMKDFHNIKDLEGELESTIAKVIKFLKKEYKKNIGSALTLTADKNFNARVEYISRVRCWVACRKYYKVSGLSDLARPLEPSKENGYSDQVKKWLQLGGLKGVK